MKVQKEIENERYKKKAIKFEAEMYGVATNQFVDGFMNGYQQGKADEQLQSIEDAKMQATEYFNTLDKAKEEAYQKGAREFAEWLCRKSRFEEIDWSGIWDRDEDNKQEFFSIDEVLAEWQKGN